MVIVTRGTTERSEAIDKMDGGGECEHERRGGETQSTLEQGDISRQPPDERRMGFLYVVATGKVDMNRVRWCLEDIFHVGIRVYGSVTRGESPEGVVSSFLHMFVEHGSASTVQELEARLTEILQSSRGGCCKKVMYEEHIDWGDGAPPGLWYQSRLRCIEQREAVLFGTYDTQDGGSSVEWCQF